MLTDKQLNYLRETYFCGGSDWRDFARAVEAEARKEAEAENKELQALIKVYRQKLQRKGVIF